MTEDQFAYSKFTLDELRSLAASPQVGTLQAMPQSFRALADHVGQVADLLTHAQADLPNWWKGPAADQAAATLGRAAAEAREFHDSAMGAATAVSRCAQVVAEQQHQMMNVPEIPGPAITDVVQRPTTPFEALEAARQDARYQAAHEQAVQVVNGIAAQYVETRAHLSTISIPGGENFASPFTALRDPAEPYSSWRQSEVSPAANTSHLGQSRSQYQRAVATSTEGRAFGPERIEPLRYQRYRPRNEQQVPHRENTTHPYSPKAVDPLVHTAAYAMESPDIPVPPTAGAHRLASNIEASDPSPERTSSTYAETSLKSPARKVPYSPQNNSSMSKAYEHSTVASPGNTGEENTRARFDAQQPTRATGLGVSTYSNDDYPAAQRSVQPSAPRKLDSLSNESDNATIVPPYGGVTSACRTSKERNPRPAYLKERKSAWLPDIVAAPADGVITPDWPKQP